VRNLLDQRWDYGVYRDDANENQLPANGQSRSVLVDLEAVF
jgi:hypothetical protein